MRSPVRRSARSVRRSRIRRPPDSARSCSRNPSPRSRRSPSSGRSSSRCSRAPRLRCRRAPGISFTELSDDALVHPLRVDRREHGDAAGLARATAYAQRRHRRCDLVVRHGRERVVLRARQRRRLRVAARRGDARRYLGLPSLPPHPRARAQRTRGRPVPLPARILARRPAQVPRLLPRAGTFDRALLAAVLRGRRESARCAVAVVRDRTCDLARQHRRRIAGGRAARAVPPQSAASRQDVPRGTLALFAASELFLRVDALVRVRVPLGRHTVPGVAAESRRAGAHADDARLGQRHSVHGGAGLAFARRRLPRLPAHDEHADSLVSEKIHVARLTSEASVSEATTSIPGREPAAGGGLIGLAERGLLPDALIRFGIRQLCAQRLREERAGDAEASWFRFQRCLSDLRTSPVAIHTDAANAQHYELPPRFFELCLGKRLKYSSCFFRRGDESLDEAEEAMLALYGERAGLADGQDILELGCGRGSLTLWMAERYPGARIVAVSNS